MFTNQKGSAFEDRGLGRYLHLERQITSCEAANPIQMLEIKSQRWHQLHNELHVARKQLDLLEKIV